MKKILITLAVIAIAFLGIKIYTDSRFEKNVITIAEYVTSNDFELYKHISAEDLPHGSQAREAFEEENLNEVTLIDEHTILIITDTFLVSAGGILVTDGTEFTAEEFIVPSKGLDGDRINGITKTDSDRIYEWHGAF